MSASLHPSSLTFAASVAPQLITSLSSNSPPLLYSQASAMHPSPVVALSHPGLILSPACDPFPQALVQNCSVFRGGGLPSSRLLHHHVRSIQMHPVHLVVGHILLIWVCGFNSTGLSHGHPTLLQLRNWCQL